MISDLEIAENIWNELKKVEQGEDSYSLNSKLNTLYSRPTICSDARFKIDEIKASVRMNNWSWSRNLVSSLKLIIQRD